MAVELSRTLCNRDCPDTCGIVATVDEGRVVRLQGDKSHPVTRGFLCRRTSQFLETQYSPERLTSPLVRRNGRLEPASWDEALDYVAERLIAIKRESGPAAIFHYRSGGSLGLLKTLSDYFFECFGPTTLKRGDICSGAGDFAQNEDFGDEDSHDLFDLLNSKQILLWGKNVYTSSPHTIPVLRDARERGAEIVLIDPVHHRSASLCDRVIQPRPGGDFALAMAIATVLFDRAWLDPEAGSYCDHLDGFERLALSKPLDVWCAEADVAPDVATDLAERLAKKRPSAILVGWGMGRRVNGAAIVRALDALSAVSGNLGVEGGGVSFYFKRRGAFDTSFARGKQAAPRTIPEPLLGPELLRLDREGAPVRAVWITAGNPVVMLPESETVKRALASRELLVVVDSFLTDTAELAHVVLPTTTLLEADDLLGAYGHHYLGVAEPVVPPPEGVLSDLEIMQRLAARVGLSEAMAGSADDWKRKMVAPKLGPRGIDLERLKAGPVRNPLAPKVLFQDRRFMTESGRVNLVTEPPATNAPPTPDFPLFLMSLSTDASQSSQWTRPTSAPLSATVHPDAAAGIAHGELAELESAIGKITVVVQHDAAQRKDVVIVPKGGHLRDGRCANALVRARLTDNGEGGALYDERVRLVPRR